MTDKVDVEPTFNEVHERLEKQHGIHWTQQVDVEPVAYHYCYTNAFGHPVWNVGFHIPSEATEWHDLVHASALAALQAENEKLKKNAEDLRDYALTMDKNHIEQQVEIVGEMKKLKAMLTEAQAENKRLEKLCDETYVAKGADAYNYACELMEQYQQKRHTAGKEVGTVGSLCDGISWVYERIDETEADAARYRWLQSNAYVGIAPHPKPHEVWCLRLPNPNGCANLDAAIDAALKGDV